MSNATPPHGHSDTKNEVFAQHMQASPGVPQAQLGAPMYAYGNPPSDEIDLVELLGFFWKIRFEIVIGLLLGVLVGAVVAFRVLPVVYKTQIPLALEQSEPALADSKKFVESFNNTLNSTETARNVWRSVFNQSPELANILKSANLTEEALAARQALSASPDKAPLRLRESASPRDFILDVNLPVQGLTQSSALVFESALQQAFSGVANPEGESTAAAGAGVTPGAPLAGGAIATSAKAPLADESQDDVREELLRAKQEYLKIEFLLNKLARGLPEYASFMNLANDGSKALQFTLPPLTESNQGLLMESQEIFVTQAQYERMHRLVAVLLSEGRMKMDEANDTVQRAQQIRDEIIQLIPVARREAAHTVVPGAYKHGAGKGGSRVSSVSVLPTLVSAGLNGAALSLEEPVSKRKIALVLGAFLGAFAGFAFGGLRIFIRKNGHRLKEVVAQ